MKAVNLIPTDQVSATRTSSPGAPSPVAERPVGAYAILGALALAIAAVALLVTTSNGIAQKKADLASTQQQAESVKAQASQLQSFADFKQLAEARQATVKGLADARFAWHRTLADVSRALPTDVYVNAVDGTTGTGAAGGASSLRGSIAAPSIEINGCTSSQASVARLMSRLRDVRGVTRVSLSKSERSETTTTAVAPAPLTAADGTTPQTTSLPCPKGSPPAFDMIIFFERAAVNPAAAPNASAAGVPSAAGPTGAAGATTPASSTTSTTTTSTTTTP